MNEPGCRWDARCTPTTKQQRTAKASPIEKENHYFLFLYHKAIIRYSFNTSNVHHYK